MFFGGNMFIASRHISWTIIHQPLWEPLEYIYISEYPGSLPFRWQDDPQMTSNDHSSGGLQHVPRVADTTHDTGACKLSRSECTCCWTTLNHAGPTIALTDLGPDALAPSLTHSYFCNEHKSPEDRTQAKRWEEKLQPSLISPRLSTQIATILVKLADTERKNI